MSTLRNAMRVACLSGLGAAFVAFAAPEPPEAKTENKKADVTVDFKIVVEGMNSIPPSSNVEFKGLNDCQPSQVARMNAEGQGKFKSPPRCIVELKIFIAGLSTRMAQVDVAKYRGSPVKIEITKSSDQPTVTIPDPTPPAVSPTSSDPR